MPGHQQQAQLVHALLSLVILCCTAWAFDAPAAAAAAPTVAAPTAAVPAQHTVCHLTLQGHNSSSSSSSGLTEIASANLTCVAPDGTPARVAVSIDTTHFNGTQISLTVSGVTRLQNEECKQQAAAFKCPPLVFFCGSYSVSLVHPVVEGVWLHSVADASADTYASGGAAMLAFGGLANASISGGSFSGNTAGRILHLQGNASVLVTASSFSSNTVSGSCIWAEGTSSSTLQDAAFINNTAYSTELTDGGAALYIADNASVAMTACSIVDNKVADTQQGWDPAKSGRWGGGIMIRTRHNAKLTMHSCLLRGNVAYLGGGLFAGGDSQVVLTDTNITANTASAGAGIYFLQQSNGTLINCSVTSNVGLGTGGGGLADGHAFTAIDSVFEGNSGKFGGALFARDAVFVRSRIVNNTAELGGGIAAVADVAGTLFSNITFIDSVCADNTALVDGGCAFLTENTTAAFFNSTLVNNSAAARGGAVFLRYFAALNITGGKVTGNKAREGGGVLLVRPAKLLIMDGRVVNNSASWRGGGVHVQAGADLRLESGTEVAGNSAAWGGGAFFDGSQEFDLAAMQRSVRNNTATYDMQLSVAPTNLSVLGSSSVSGFVSLLGSDQSVLPVRLNVSGPFGLPCDGQLVQALLNGTQVLGMNRSDSSGVVLMRLDIRLRPGMYTIVFEVLPGDSQKRIADLKPAKLSLQVRSCIVGEVTPAPDACQVCPEGSFSLEPHSSSCRDCPAGADCPGGFAIVPLPGMWHSAPESPQVHRCFGTSACQGNRSALEVCASSADCRAATSSSSYTNLQCTPGYQGNLCAACEPGHHLVKPFTCRKCLSQAAAAVLFVLAVCLLLVFMKIMCHFTADLSEAAGSFPSVASTQPVDVRSAEHVAREGSLTDDTWTLKQLQVSSLLRPLVLYMQYALILASVTAVELPAPLAYPLQALAWAWSPAVPETLSIECILPHGSSSMFVSIQRMLLYLAMPFVMLALLVVMHMLTPATLCKRLTDNMSFTSVFAVNAMVVCFFFMSSILRSTFGWFACVPMDAPNDAPYVAAAVGSFWLHDPGQLCYQGYNRAWALGLGLPLLLLVCGVLPAYVVWVVLRNKHQQQHLPGQSEQVHGYGFLQFIYRPACNWWEVVVLCETAALSAVAVFGHRLGPLHHIIAFSCTLTVMGLLHMAAQPYTLPAANTVVLQCLCCLFFSNMANVLFLGHGIFRAGGAAVTGVGCAVLLGNVVFVGSVLWQLVRLLSGKQAVRGEADASIE